MWLKGVGWKQIFPDAIPLPSNPIAPLEHEYAGGTVEHDAAATEWRALSDAAAENVPPSGSGNNACASPLVGSPAQHARGLRLRAVFPVHLNGQSADMRALAEQLAGFVERRAAMTHDDLDHVIEAPARAVG